MPLKTLEVHVRFLNVHMQEEPNMCEASFAVRVKLNAFPPFPRLKA